MPSRQFNLDGVGLVTIAKRRNNTNLRLSIKPNRQVSLSMPYWTPYIVGQRFIKSRETWIKQQLLKIPANLLQSGDLVGKNHRLHFVSSSSSQVNVRQTSTEIIISSSLDPTSSVVQARARKACDRALKLQSEKLLRIRAQGLSAKYNLQFKVLKFRKLTSRWGSCSSHKTITLNIYLIQLPWHLIDYVIVHELVHLMHMDHSREFWNLLESLLPDAKKLRREIKAHSPIIETIRSAAVS